MTHKLNWFVHSYEQLKHENSNKRPIININRFIADLTMPIELYNFMDSKQMNEGKYEDERLKPVGAEDEKR